MNVFIIGITCNLSYLRAQALDSETRSGTCLTDKSIDRCVAASPCAGPSVGWGGQNRDSQGSRAPGAPMLSSEALMSRGERGATQCCPGTSNICSGLVSVSSSVQGGWGSSSSSRPHYSLCSPWTSSPGIPRELVRNTEPQAPPQSHCTRTCMLTRCPGCPRAQGS